MDGTCTHGSLCTPDAGDTPVDAGPKETSPPDTSAAPEGAVAGSDGCGCSEVGGRGQPRASFVAIGLVGLICGLRARRRRGRGPEA